MRWFHRLKLRIERIVRRRQLDRDLEDELRFHLEMLAEEHPDARRRFGNTTRWKETCRELWMFGWLETWLQDVRYAVRSMRRSPAFAVVAVLTMGLAIGATSAIFSVVDGVMLRSLPYRDADRLAILWTSVPKDHEDEDTTSVPNFEDWKRASRSFESMSFYASNGATIIDPAGRLEPQKITYAEVAGDFFRTAGVSPFVGRSFSEQEFARGERLVVLSHAYWQARYAGSPGAVGRAIELNNKIYQIVGVMPRDFYFPTRKVELWAPATAGGWWPDYLARRGRRGVVVFGRLRREFTVNQAQAEMGAIASRLAAEHRDTNEGLTVRVVPLQAQVLGKRVPFLLLLFSGAVLFVLLIACANVANLLLARGAARRREIALRTALGAGRMRLVRQMVTESLVLSFCGGALGVVLASWGVSLLALYGPRNIPRLEEIRVDARVLLFTLAAAAITGVLFGLAPAWRTLKVAALASRRPSRVLAIAEFALAVVLLTGAGLLIRSYLAVRAVDPGFQARHAVTMDLSISGPIELYDRAYARIRAIPGVESVGAINDIFFSRGEKAGGGSTLDEVEGHAPEPRERWKSLVITPVSGDAFQAMGLRLLQGRMFNDHDGEHDPLVVIVNEAMARRYWRGEDPVGKRFKGYPGNHKDWVTVIGLVKDVRNNGLERETTSQMFAAPKQFKPGAILVVRSMEEPERLAAAVRRAVHELDARAVVGAPTTLEEQLDAQTAQRRFESSLLGIFSLLAVVLAAVGIYGLLHYSVAQRTREIGVRMALGARPGDVVAMVVREGLVLAGIGVAIGLAGSMALTRAISSLLFGVSPGDPLTFGAVALLLSAVAVSASYMPARRATRVDPIRALRT